MDKAHEIDETFSEAVRGLATPTPSHLRCLIKAMDRVNQLLSHEEALRDYDQIHSAKSILYAVIEQMGLRGERIFTVQRMLRELLSIVNTQYQSPGHDKQVGLQILSEIRSRFYTLP